MGEFPNKSTQFKKGQSGNPNGRPPSPECYRHALRKYLAMTPQELYNEVSQDLKLRDDITVADACAMLDAAQAMVRDNWRQRQANADRTDGKPRQEVIAQHVERHEVVIELVQTVRHALEAQHGDGLQALTRQLRVPGDLQPGRDGDGA